MNSATSSSSEITAGLLRRKRRRTSALREANRATSTPDLAVVAVSVVTGSLIGVPGSSRKRSSHPYPWIERGIDYVGQQPGQQDCHAGKERDRSDDVRVLRRDALNEPLTDTVPAEDLLGEHRTGEETGDAVGEQCGHRDQRSAQAMFEQCAASRQSLGARRANEVLTEDVEHRVSLISAVAGDGAQRQRERRQHQMLYAIDELVPGATDRVR